MARNGGSRHSDDEDRGVKAFGQIESSEGIDGETSLAIDRRVLDIGCTLLQILTPRRAAVVFVTGGAGPKLQWQLMVDRAS